MPNDYRQMTAGQGDGKRSARCELNVKAAKRWRRRSKGLKGDKGLCVAGIEPSRGG